MSAINVGVALDEIALLKNQKDKTDALKQLLSHLRTCPTINLTEQNAAHLRSFVENVVKEDVGLVASRLLLQDFLGYVDELEVDVKESLLQFTLDKVQTRAVSFEEQISTICEKIARLHEDREDWEGAANALRRIPLDSGHRAISDTYKLDIYIRIAGLLVEGDEALAAEGYLNRAALLIPESTDPATNLKFKLYQARVLDTKRKFLEASSKYLELSYSGLLEEEERERCLKEAVVCAVLAGAGPQRSRMLATLYKDERTSRLAFFSILKKMHFDRVLRAAEVTSFASSLLPHQLARLPYQSTVLDRAVMEHNILSASKIYRNITFEELGSLLAISADQAEAVAGRMIEQDRLNGMMDQIERLITFKNGPSESGELTSAWDGRIQGICHHVESVILQISQKYPEYAAMKGS